MSLGFTLPKLIYTTQLQFFDHATATKVQVRLPYHWNITIVSLMFIYLSVVTATCATTTFSRQRRE